MKIAALKFKSFYLLLIALLLASPTWAEEDIEKSKSFTYSQKFNPEGTINFTTHSNIVEINTWDKNEVKVIATIRVEAENEKDIEALFADIKFEPQGTENKIELINPLRINQKPAFQITSYVVIYSQKFKKVELSNGDKIKLKSYKVKYEVFLPVKTKLNLINSYGDVKIIGDLKGESTFVFNSSKFSAENLDRIKMTVKYGKARIKSMKDAKIYLFEGEMDLEKGRELEINSKYSKLKIDQANKINLTSFEDKVKIGKTDELKSNMKYGELWVSEARSIRIPVAYELEVEIGQTDELISASSKYSAYKIREINKLLFSSSFEDQLDLYSVERIRVDGKYGKINIEKLGMSCEIRGYETKIKVGLISEEFKNIEMDGKYMNIKLNMPKVAYQYQSKLTYGSVVYNAADFKVTKRTQEGETQELFMEFKGEEGLENPRFVKVIGYETNVKLN